MKSPAFTVILSAVALAVLFCPRTTVLAGEDAKASMDALRQLAGSWITKDKPGNDADTSVFRVTANGSTVVETMFPGQQHEMINTFHMDGDRLVMTHYCAQGVQPRLKLVSSEGGVMKFEFLDGTNLKPGEGHMGSLELTIAGDKLIEKWGYLKDGKVEHSTTFELTRKS